MLLGGPVVDATVHNTNLAKDNWVDDPGDGRQARAIWHHHVLYNRVVVRQNPAAVLSEEEFLSDFDGDSLAHAVFAESYADMAILNALPGLGIVKGAVTDVVRAAALRDRYPNRFLLYGWVNTLNLKEAIRDLERQVREFKIDGLKCYPALQYNGKFTGWLMNDPEFAIPLFEAARDLGIRNIAIHKALAMGNVPELAMIKPDDLNGVLPRFPEINFHMVHAGMAFVQETRLLLQSHRNFYANLESTFANAVERPQLLLEALGEFLYWGTPEQIVFASGCNLMHGQPMLEAFANLQMPQDWVEGRGYPALTDKIKRQILGENILRCHGIDFAGKQESLQNDEFAAIKRDGLRPPWSGLRERRRGAEYAGKSTAATSGDIS